MAISFPPSLLAPPPLSGPDLPGASIGKATTYWIAPYVLVSDQRIGGRKTTLVTWFSEDGNGRAMSVAGGVQPGFVHALEHDQPVILGVNEAWKIVLPKEPEPDPTSKFSRSGSITSTPDSRTFVHEFHPEGGQIALDIFVHGTRVPTFGPFIQHRAEGVHLSDDGSAALLIWKDSAKTTPQIVLTDSNGKPSIRVDCDDADLSPIAAPDGVGALLQAKGEGKTPNTFTWYTREGKVRSIDVSPNPHCIGWVPGTQKSLFSTTLDVHRYQMIDWASGKKLWDISCPANGQALAIGITSRVVIFAVAELYQGGPWRGAQWVLENNRTEWIRAFYAINAEDGSLLSRWQAKYPGRLSNDDRAHFLRLGKKLFYVTADEFVELSEDDMILGRQGWKR